MPLDRRRFAGKLTEYFAQTRLSAEDITINIGKGVKVPAPPAGHAWRAVVHDDQVTWLATWHENINNAVK